MPCADRVWCRSAQSVDGPRLEMSVDGTRLAGVAGGRDGLRITSCDRCWGRRVTGWLHHTANGQTAAEQAVTLRAAEEVFNHNWLTGNLSVAGSVSAVAWAVIAIAGAVALRRAG